MPMIQRPDLVAKIRKTYELVGPDPIASISPELVPVVVIDNLVDDDPGDSRLFAAGDIVVTAVAGQASEAHLFNPAASGVDLFLEHMHFVDETGSAFYYISYFAAALAGAGTTINRNLGAAGEPAGRVLGAAAAVPIGVSLMKYYSNTAGDAKRSHDQKWRIPPGEGIGFTAVTVNHTIAADFFWHERPAR